MFETLPLLVKKALAWSVHLFTATGAIWGFLTINAIFEQNWRMVIIWHIIAMFVDGFDGMLARWFHVKEYAREIDGGLLDNIIDYVNYVVVAALKKQVGKPLAWWYVPFPEETHLTILHRALYKAFETMNAKKK